jgi:AcrR family transcriptional regulator
MGILRAAARIFRDRGFAESGMRDIAEAADLSPANLYHYFSGKDEILYFCQDRSLDLMLSALARARAGGNGLTGRLRQVLKAHAHAVLDEVEGGAAHLAVDALPDPLRRKIVAKRDRYEHALRRLVSEGIKRGEFTDCDAAVTTRAMLGAINWSATWYRPGGEWPADAVADMIASYLVRGLTAEPPSADAGRSRER